MLFYIRNGRQCIFRSTAAIENRCQKWFSSKHRPTSQWQEALKANCKWKRSNFYQIYKSYSTKFNRLTRFDYAQKTFHWKLDYLKYPLFQRKKNTFLTNQPIYEKQTIKFSGHIRKFIKDQITTESSKTYLKLLHFFLPKKVCF